MAIPLVYAAGIGVIVTASCAAWVFNELSKEERSKQKREKEKQRDLYRQFQEESSQHSKKKSDIAIAVARQQLHDSVAQLHEFQEKLPEIDDGIEELFEVINYELQADSTSPSRKLALRGEYCRIEDASARLSAYREYLVEEEQTLRALFNAGRFQDLMVRELPQPLLPTEWLYPGKLVIVEHDEIFTWLKPYDQKILFDRTHELQRSFALNTGDEFPVLITSKHKKNSSIFYACVARGILCAEHLSRGVPLEMEIFAPGSQSHRCQAFGGLVQADLPKVQMQEPGLRVLKGQKLSVYPTSYDLCLRKNPFLSKNARIEVSEFPVQTAGGEQSRDIYLEVDERQLGGIEDLGFFSESKSWSIVDYDTEQREITLGRSCVRVTCKPDADAGVLTLIDIQECGTPQIGSSFGFNLVLISDKLGMHELISWPDGVVELERQALQISLAPAATKRREAQARFMRRWGQIIEFQIAQEYQAEVEFTTQLKPSQFGNRKSVAFIPIDALEDTTNQVHSPRWLYEEIVSSDWLKIEKCCRVEYWDSARGQFLPAISQNAVRSSQYHLEPSGLYITGHFKQKLSQGKNETFRFSIRMPSGALERQRAALDEFFNDRMVDPQIKDILLAPDAYQPSKNTQRRGISNYFGQLNDSQKDAVNMALGQAPVTLIQGPPGTGKTTVIVELLKQILSQDQGARVLVVSQQNAAVDNALERYLLTLNESGQTSDTVIRVGSTEKISQKLLPYQIDSVMEQFLDSLKAAGTKVFATGTSQTKELAEQWLEFLDQDRHSQHDHQELALTLLSGKQVVGATCVGLATKRAGVDNLKFDVAIIDEAGRSTVPELLIPLMRARKVVLIGDHYQLPPSIAPILREDEAQESMEFLSESFLEKSFFETLFEQLPADCTSTLREQFRMSPKIGTLVSDLFYNEYDEGGLINGASVYDQSDDIFEHSLVWVNVAGQQAKLHNQSTSWINADEAKAIIDFFLRIQKRDRIDSSVEVAVITPYGDQKRHLLSELGRIATSHRNGNLVTLGGLRIKVDTVDSFQGSEADLVCYSPVRTKPPLSFILDRKRLNVACSRAKKHLVFFGHKKFLSSCKPSRQGERNLFTEIIGRSVIFGV